MATIKISETGLNEIIKALEERAESSMQVNELLTGSYEISPPPLQESYKQTIQYLEEIQHRCNGLLDQLMIIQKMESEQRTIEIIT